MGSYLPIPKTEKISDDKTSQNGKVEYGASAMQGWRNTMEDAHICELDMGDGVHFFGVYDGHGGHEVAEFVKEHLIMELKNLQSFQAKDYAQALIDVYDKMDELLRTPYGQTKLVSYKKQEGDQPPQALLGRQTENIAASVGCTACSAIITPTDIFVGNAGDSRAVVAKKPVNGFHQAIPLSVDHKPDHPDEKRRIMCAGGFVSDNRVKGNLNLARSIGDLEYKSDPKIRPHEQMLINTPEVRQFKVADASFLIIACDGIWDCLTSQEAVNYVANIPNKKMKKSEIIEAIFTTIITTDVQASGGIGTDNMSAILIFFN